MRKPVPSLPVLGTDKPAGRDDHRARVQHFAVAQLYPPPGVNGGDVLHGCIQSKLCTAALRELQQPIAHVAGTLGRGKELCRFDLLDERQPELALEERHLFRRGHERTILRTRCGGESLTNRDSSRRAGRMLHRPPPLIRILRPPSAVRSRRRVSAPAAAEKIAAMVPAAPAPMTTTRIRRSEAEVTGR